MPNDLSNAFHADLKAIEADFVKIITNLEHGGATVLADLKAVFTQVVDQAGPVLVAAAAAGVNAALSGTTGGLSALVSAGEAAAVEVIKTQGVQIADEGLQQLKTLVLGNVLKANSNPAASATPSGNTVTGG